MAVYRVAMLSQRRRRAALGQAAVLIVLGLGAVAMVFPLVWMVSSSLKPLAQIDLFPPKWIPTEQVKLEVGGKIYPLYNVQLDGHTRQLLMVDKVQRTGIFADPADPSQTLEVDVRQAKPVERVRFRWENYIEAMIAVPFHTYAVNTIIVVFGSMAGMLISTTLVAYGFSRFRAPGLGVLFLILLSTTMLPSQVTLIPTYILFSKLGWIDTLKPLIVPSFFAGAYDVFLLRQYFMTIPLEMDDAAKIDGCGPYGIFFRMIMPMSTPALGVTAIFSFTGMWNAFMGPLIYLNEMEKFPLALGLRAFQPSGQGAVQWESMMAISVLMTVPMLVLFFITQRSYIQGIVITGVKG